MQYDPILKELHKAKDAVARKAGYDIHRLCEMLRAAEKLHPERLAKIKPTHFPNRKPKIEAKTKNRRSSSL